jgi:hypothetical protein
MDLPYEARIRIRYDTEGELGEAIREHAGWIRSETLATELDVRDPSSEPSGTRHDATVDELPLQVWVEA